MTPSHWDRVVAKAKGHKTIHPAFDVEDYLAFVRRRGVHFVRWAAGRSTGRVDLARQRWLRDTRRPGGDQ